MNKIIVFPGGFHPFHQGHLQLYKELVMEFKDDEVYVATTDFTEERPFSFEDKKFLMIQAGVPESAIKLVKSPYKPEEITNGKEDSALILVVSEKDKFRLSFKKKEGSPAYYQPYDRFDDENLEPLTKHAYVLVKPVDEFKLLGKTVDSATYVRQIYKDTNKKDELIQQLYPKSTDKEKIKKILDKNLLKESKKYFVEFKKPLLNEAAAAPAKVKSALTKYWYNIKSDTLYSFKHFDDYHHVHFANDNPEKLGITDAEKRK